MSRRTSRRAGVLAAMACLLLSGLGLGAPGLSPAMATPPGGPGADTPGTSSSVSPRTLRAGEVIGFSVSGFPAGQVVYVKVDDGNFCSQRGVHGACVVHQQRIGSLGSVRGSFRLPADLKPGQHWLRFLASERITDAKGQYLGVKGYTCRGGSNFRIVAGGGDTASISPSGTSDGTSSPGGTAATSADGSTSASGSVPEVVAAGEVLALPAPDGGRGGADKESADKKGADQESADRGATAAPAPATSVEASPAPTPDPDTTPAETTPAATRSQARFPVVGGLGLLLCCAGAVALVLRFRAVARRARG